MTTTDTGTRKVVTVPRGPYAVTEAIEKSGLVNIESVETVSVTGLTYTYAIDGDEPSTDTIRLTIELTADELNSVQAALGRAASSTRGHATTTDMLELLHLRTLLAEAAAPDRKDTT